MKSLPCLMFRLPGPHRKPGINGISYDFIGAATPEEYQDRLDKGWFPTLDEASAGALADKAIEAASELREIVEEIGGPSRSALEEEARALEIGFNARTSDTVLAQRIAAKKG